MRLAALHPAKAVNPLKLSGSLADTLGETPLVANKSLAIACSRKEGADGKATFLRACCRGAFGAVDANKLRPVQHGLSDACSRAALGDGTDGGEILLQERLPDANHAADPGRVSAASLRGSAGPIHDFAGDAAREARRSVLL